MKKFSRKLCMQAIGLSLFVLFIFSCNKDVDPWPPPPPHDTNFIIQALPLLCKFNVDYPHGGLIPVI